MVKVTYNFLQCSSLANDCSDGSDSDLPRIYFELSQLQFLINGQ